MQFERLLFAGATNRLLGRSRGYPSLSSTLRICRGRHQRLMFTVRSTPIAAAEAIARGVRLGLDRQAFFDVIAASSGASWISGDRMGRALAGGWVPGARRDPHQGRRPRRRHGWCGRHRDAAWRAVLKVFEATLSAGLPTSRRRRDQGDLAKLPTDRSARARCVDRGRSGKIRRCRAARMNRARRKRPGRGPEPSTAPPIGHRRP